MNIIKNYIMKNVKDVLSDDITECYNRYNVLKRPKTTSSLLDIEPKTFKGVSVRNTVLIKVSRLVSEYGSDLVEQALKYNKGL